MSYIDGFVAPVPTKNKDAYKASARKGWEVFKKHGALDMVETWGDNVPAGTVTDFQRSVALKDDETVVFSWVVWPDKATREKAYEAMKDEDMGDMPFDGKRMIYGGFEPIFEANR